MLAHLFPFVKNFFQILTNFFVRRPRGQLGYNTIQSSLCQGFFTFLAVFFIVFYSETTVSGGEIVADLRQSVSRIDAGFVLHCQVTQADHAAESSVFHDGQSSDLLPAHQSRREGDLHVRSGGDHLGRHHVPDRRGRG